jgi:hypothetical protein
LAAATEDLIACNLNSVNTSQDIASVLSKAKFNEILQVSGTPAAGVEEELQGQPIAVASQVLVLPASLDKENDGVK